MSAFSFLEQGADALAEEWNADSAFEEKGTAQRRSMQDALRQGRSALKRTIDAGLTNEEFSQGQALLEAYDAALLGAEKALKKRGL